MTEEPIILERLPDAVQATIEARDRALEALGSSVGGMESVVEELRRWLPGSTLRVAFLGGTTELHRDIAETVAEIEQHANLTFDFGYDEAGDSYRSWSEADTDYAAEIRVSFDQRGFFSLVGMDSIAPNVGPAGGPVGGRPGQRSLNLGGFHIQRPATWRGTVLHEFLHALSFHHEHVNQRGPCQEAFRFEDDPGYVSTRDHRGVFVADAGGRRPGIYTYLSGPPNFWPRAVVDHNLRPGSEPVTESAFDRSSVMLYRFPTHFYRTPGSGCAPDGNGQDLSAGDIAGLEFLYPADDAQASAVRATKEALMSGLAAYEAPAAAEGLTLGADSSTEGASLLGVTLDTLRRHCGAAL